MIAREVKRMKKKTATYRSDVWPLTGTLLLFSVDLLIVVQVKYAYDNNAWTDKKQDNFQAT
jgi:hypothetical protein